MIKEEIKKIPAQPAREQKMQIHYCDICGNRADNYRICTICSRECCRKFKDTCGNVDLSELGDYPDWYCRFCYKLRFEKYQKDFDRIEEKQIVDEEALINKIKKESLELK